MNYGKITAISNSLKGIFFSLGLLLIATWNVAGQIFINPFHGMDWAWSLFALAPGCILAWNLAQFFSAKDIREETSQEVAEESPGLFNTIHLIRQSDKNLSEVIGSFLFFCLGLGLNCFAFSEGKWGFTAQMGFLCMGSVCPFLFWNKLKAGRKIKKVSQNTPARKGGSFIVEFKNDDTLVFTLPLEVIGKDSGQPDPSFSVSLSEIRDFRVFKTVEESIAFRERNIDGDLEFNLQSTINSVTFDIKPEFRPSHYYHEGSTGDFDLFIAGRDFKMFLALQPQCFEVISMAHAKSKTMRAS